jgi:hypothetical protein
VKALLRQAQGSSVPRLVGGLIQELPSCPRCGSKPKEIGIQEKGPEIVVIFRGPGCYHSFPYIRET